MALTKSRSTGVLQKFGSATMSSVLSMMLLTATTVAVDPPTCLNSDSKTEPFDLDNHPECVKDKLNVSSNGLIQDAAKMFGITTSEVAFIGCDAAPFQTNPIRLSPPFKFRILYSTRANRSLEKVIAPILHELGHVFQIKQAGGFNALVKSRYGTIERLELGADFLAGLAAKRLGMDRNDFQVNLALVGGYDKDSSDSHGLPDDRAAAFRSGYYYRTEKSSLTSQYADFENNEFGYIKHN